jgi:hypothetical protein
MPTNCSTDVNAAISYLDALANGGNKALWQQTRTQFGITSNKVFDDDFLS